MKANYIEARIKMAMGRMTHYKHLSEKCGCDLCKRRVANLDRTINDYQRLLEEEK